MKPAPENNLPDHSASSQPAAASAETAGSLKGMADKIFFVSLCTHNRKCIFGEIKNQQVVLNPLGEKIQELWYNLPLDFPYVLADLFVLMPNHLHGLLLYSGPRHKTPESPAGAPEAETGLDLSDILQQFMLSSTCLMNECEGQNKGPLWRETPELEEVANRAELHARRDYIAENPLHWEQDPMNPVSHHGKEPPLNYSAN